MKRLKIYLIFFVVSIVISFLSVLPSTVTGLSSSSAGRPFPSGQTADGTFVYVAGYPLYFMINGTTGPIAQTTDRDSDYAFHNEIEWGNFAIDVMFWFLLLVMLFKAWDLYKEDRTH